MQRYTIIISGGVSSWFSHSSSLLLLCCFMVGGSCSLIATQYTYYEQHNIFLSTAETQIVVRVDFNETAYLFKQCPMSSEPAVIVRCCQQQDYSHNDSSLCYTPSDPNYLCIDNFTKIHEHESHYNSNSTNPSYYVTWKIQNPLTCSGFGVATVDYVGRTQYTLTIGPTFPQPYYYEGYPSLFLCCSDIRALMSATINPYWDGSLLLTIDSNLYFNPQDHPARFQLLFETDIGKLPMKHFYNQAQINFVDDDLQTLLVSQESCQGNVLGTVSVKERKCSFLYPPRDDALYWFYKSVTYIEQPPPLDNMLTFVYRKVVKDYNEENSEVNTLNNYIIQMLNVVDMKGNNMTNPVLILREHFVPGNSCSYSKFQPLFDEFVQIVSEMSLPEYYSTSSFQILQDYLYDAAKAPTVSVQWQGCKYHAAYFLSDVITEQRETTTKECIKIYGTSDYAVDPCCNQTLSSSMCCIQRSVVESVERYSPSKLESQNSLAPVCSLNSLDQFNSLNFDNLDDLNTKCPQIPQINSFGHVYVGGNTETTLYDRCNFLLSRRRICNDGQSPRNCMYYSGGNTKAECIYGPSKISLTTSYDRTCTIPCLTDSDCVFAGGAVSLKCRIHGYYNNCEPLKGYDSNFWMSPEAVDPIISCVSGFISEFDEKTRFKIYKLLGIPFTTNKPVTGSLEKINLDKSLKNYVTKEGCSDSYYRNYYSECSKNLKCNWFYISDFEAAECNTILPPMTDGFCGRCTDPDDDNSSCTLLSQVGECLWGNEYAQYDLDAWGLENYPQLNQPFSYYFCEEQFHGAMFRHRLACMVANFTKGQSPNSTGEWQYNGALTREGCLPNQFCDITDIVHDVADGMDHNLVYEETCESYCYWNGVNQSTCEDYGFSWLSWTIDKIQYSKCIVPGVYYSHCDSYNKRGFQNVSWWQGAAYFPLIRETPEKCTSYCRYNNKLNETECLANGHCSNPLCMECDKEQCENSGICDVKPGCYIEYDSFSSCSQYHLSPYPELQGINIHWWPWGCRVAQFIRVNRLTCQRIASVTQKGYFYLPYGEWSQLNKTSCESIGWSYCELPLSFISSSNYQLGPENNFYSSLIPRACNTCSTIPPRTKWIRGQWIASDDQWIEVRWKNRKYVPTSNLTDVVDISMLSTLLENAVISSEIELVKSSILCREGNMKDILLQLSCLTGDDRQSRTAFDCRNTFQTNQVIADLTICSDLVTTYNFEQLGSFIVTRDFTLRNFACLKLTVSMLLQSQIQRAERSLSGRLPMPKSQIGRGEFQYVLNSRNVVVGKMIGNGIRFTFQHSTDESSPPYNGLQVCLDLNALQTTSHETIEAGNHLWVGIANEALTQLTPIDATLVLNNSSNLEQICFIVQNSVIVFPISIQNNYESITYDSTFMPSEVGMLIFGLCIYSIVIVLGLINLVGHILIHKRVKLQKGAAESLAAMLFSLLRLVFWSIILTGLYITNLTSAIIFLAELPALILFLALSLVVSKLAEVYHSSRNLKENTRRVKYIFVGFSVCLTILLIFAMLFTSFYPLTFTQQDCFSPAVVEVISTPDIVALIYLVVFLISGMVIIVCLIFYAQKLVKFIKHQKSTKRKKTHMLTYIAYSASLSLLAQCFFIVVQLVQGWEWSTIAITSYLIIVDMHTLLLLLHYSHSANASVRNGREKIRRASLAKGGGGVSIVGTTNSGSTTTTDAPKTTIN